jgi:thiamine transporter
MTGKRDRTERSGNAGRQKEAFMRNPRIQTIVEIALCVALSAVLNLLAMRLPINIAGGSISLTMLPIAIIALRRGIAAGAIAGTLFGFLDLLMEPFILVPVQVALDYPVPYLLFGAGVGLFAAAYRHFAYAAKGGAAPSREASPNSTNTPSSPNTLNSRNSTSRRAFASSALIVIAFIIGGALRYFAHVLSGVFFFAEYAGDQSVAGIWAYSLIYNISYLAPSLAASCVLALILMPILNRAVPARRPQRDTATPPK